MRRLIQLLFSLLLAAPFAADAQIVRSFSSVYSENVNGNLLLVGNTLETCPFSAGQTCFDARAGTVADGNDDFSMVYVDIDSDASTFDSSSADLSLPPGASVLYARLYWGGRSPSTQRGDALIDTPASAGYVAVSDSVVDFFVDFSR